MEMGVYLVKHNVTLLHWGGGDDATIDGYINMIIGGVVKGYTFFEGEGGGAHDANGSETCDFDLRKQITKSPQNVTTYIRTLCTLNPM